MNAAHLHLLLNHIPVIGLLGAVSILAAGAIARNATLVRTSLWAFALLALWLYRAPRTLPRWFAGVALLAALIPAGMLAWTAELGGRIRHEEIRASWTPPPEAAQDEETGEQEEPDEEER